ncbi:MAG: choice-of-anchor B family protein [Candidatus Marinimicrobia bacterium]|nr:choice-of-anchor B family protein [Candidatus Neomarinimicrobiota bacterium]MCH7955376.1 choice-of-anchor B family protein [Candidatus Neomarinimicrobiota bacterium]
MKRAILFSILLLWIITDGSGLSSTAELEKIGIIQFPTTLFNGDSVGGSDVWGWTGSDGTEYALMGVLDGIAVVNTSTMQVVTTVPGPTEADPFYHRDIKTYKHYAYAVSENTGADAGLIVFDLQSLPDKVSIIGYFPIDNSGSVRSHNISIDTSMGFAYLEGNTSNRVIIIDLSDPEHPLFAGSFNANSVHDLYARNDTVYLAEPGNQSFSIWDLSDKTDPKLLVRHEIPDAGVVHTIWPTNNSQYVVTTEETSGKTVKIWDVADYDDITLVGEWLGSSGLAHNSQVKDDLLFISHYQSGLYVLDISDPSNPTEIAHYDTYPPGESPVFNGNWGVYQYTQNGMVFASDLEGRLTILNFDRSAIGINLDDKMPLRRLSLLGNYPNPFNPSTNIEFYLSEAGSISLNIYNINGEFIETLAEGFHSAGEHRYKWSGDEYATGVYVYALKTSEGLKSGKMLLIK